MESKSKARRSVQWKLFWGVLMLLIVVGGGLSYYLIQESNKAKRLAEEAETARREREKIMREWQDKERLAQEQQDELNKKIHGLASRLSDAKDEGKRELLRKQLDAQRDKSRRLAEARAREKADAMKRAKRIRIGKSNDPLGGLGL